MIRKNNMMKGRCTHGKDHGNHQQAHRRYQGSPC